MKTPVLVCLSLPPPHSGEETLSLNLKKGLDEIASPDLSLHYFDISNKKGNTTRGKFGFGNVSAVTRLAFQFFKTLLKLRPSVVYLPIAQNRLGFLKYSLFIALATLFRCKVVATLGGSNFHRFFENASFVLKVWIRMILKRIDVLIVQGQDLKGQFEGLIDFKKMEVVHPGIDSAPLLKCEKKEKLSEDINVLFVGCLSKAKGVFDLLQAVSLCVAQFPKIHFHLAGEVLQRERNILNIDNPKDNREAFFEWLSKPMVKPYVTLHGVLTGENLFKLYQQADIFILPSYCESFPMVLMEASAFGLPLITTRVGANEEVYQEGKNALFVSIGSPQELAQKILTLARDPILRKKMGDNNREKIKNFTHLDFAKKIATLLVFQLKGTTLGGWEVKKAKEDIQI